jgi:GYF domain 2
MTQENLPSPSARKTPRPGLRPPDFLLPQADKPAARARNGEPNIYVSCGEQVYGPAAVDDVLSGVRTSYFEEDALFWFEGLEEWRPVAELSALFGDAPADLPREARHHPPPPEGIKPPWPGSRSRSSSSGQKRRRRSHRNRAAKPTRAQIGGRLVVIGAVLLAVLLTAGLLLLISLA